MAWNQICSTSAGPSAVCSASRSAQRTSCPESRHGKIAPSKCHRRVLVDSVLKHGNQCWSYRRSPDELGVDEDCLFLDVYVPANITTDAKLPVLFYILAGGFNFNAGADADRRGLII